ncbi:MAG: class I SAM-dependent methyltransferase [Deltaproteobacteria bacterium]|nr:class I SAM-dependent methyltransferase [Deltaproteobacteria bacterium]
MAGDFAISPILTSAVQVIAGTPLATAQEVLNVLPAGMVGDRFIQGPDLSPKLPTSAEGKEWRRTFLMRAFNALAHLENKLLYPIDSLMYNLTGPFRKDWQSVISTRRPPSTCIEQLHLDYYDFSNKKILDVACGRSRFAQFINLFYGDTGTLAVALDKNIKHKPPLRIKGNAYKLPFQEPCFDLVTCNFLLHHFSFGRQLMFIEEMVRVTKPGGQIHIGGVFETLNLGAIEELSRVERFFVHEIRSYEGLYSVEIRLKS